MRSPLIFSLSDKSIRLSKLAGDLNWESNGSSLSARRSLFWNSLEEFNLRVWKCEFNLHGPTSDLFCTAWSHCNRATNDALSLWLGFNWPQNLTFWRVCLSLLIKIACFFSEEHLLFRIWIWSDLSKKLENSEWFKVSVILLI